MNSFVAILNRKSGLLTIDRFEITFIFDENPEEKVTIQRGDLLLAIGGQNSPRLLLSSRHDPENIISSADRGVLALLAHYHYESADTVKAQIGSRGRRRKISLFVAIAAIVLLILGVPLLGFLMPSTFVKILITPKSEESLGQFLMRHRASSSFHEKSIDDIHSLVEVLQSSTPELSALKVKIHIVESEEVNAYAAPGDHLIVNTSLIQTAQTVEEIMGVLAHELGHMTERHAIKSMGGQVSLIAGVLLLSPLLGDATDIVMKGLQIGQLSFSRDYEREADAKAVVYLKNAGLSARGLHDFLSRLDDSNAPSALRKGLGLLQTHPLSSERLAVISAEIDGFHEEKTRVLPRSLKILKANIKGD